MRHTLYKENHFFGRVTQLTLYLCVCVSLLFWEFSIKGKNDLIIYTETGISIVVQWLRLRTFTPGGVGSTPGQELRSHIPPYGVAKWNQSVSRLVVSDCVTPWTVAHQALLSMELSRKNTEWVDIPFPRGSSGTSDQTCISCTTSRFFTVWANREVSWPNKQNLLLQKQICTVSCHLQAGCSRSSYLNFLSLLPLIFK